MKLLFTLIIAILFAGTVQAQVTDVENKQALQLIQSNRYEINLSDYDLKNSIVASTYNNKSAGTVMVYLQQTYKDVAIYNQLLTLAFKDGKLVSKSGEFIHNIESVGASKSSIPSANAYEAVMAAIADRKLTPKLPLVQIENTNSGKKVIFNNAAVSHQNITAELMWFASPIGKKTITLGWQVYIIQNTSADYWLVNIDAINKNTISIHNLTVYCNYDAPKNGEISNHVHSENCISNVNKTTITNSPTIVNGASYRVVPYPAESPVHPGGTPVLVTDPWLLSGAVNNATTLKWHSIGANNFTSTRGNNVWSQEDRDGNNGTSPTQVISSTPTDPLTFDFVPNFTIDPTQSTPVPNQQFNTTNLFYWNNIIHDLTYQYGFDEAARNFQGDNLNRGGVGNDFVLADAQDGTGTNNANFATPADGSSGRMQMYLWTSSPNLDGDADNGIIAHEYAHGISNRLTGNGSSCLGNAEQMGEGWSDYYSLMYTQDWANSTLSTGFNSPRGIGTYAINQPPSGLGIRSQRYCTNFAVNNKVYATTISAQQHSRGEIWCATLWDMTWGIINQVGSINPNLFNASAAGGNSIALRLVTEGLKLQPCSPGFISSRDAILQADMILYGGAYRCTILEAFRRRGMGLGASQGSSASVTDQTPSFTNSGAALQLSQGNIVTVAEGQNITYTNKVTTDACAGITNYILTDTLPLNVTYVSGGTYNAGTRVVSFAVNQAAATINTYSFVVNVNAGTYFAPVTVLNEPVPATMPATFTPTTTVPAGGNLWTVSTLQTNSAPNAFFVVNEVISTDKRLELTNGLALPNNISSYPKLSFAHRFNTEEGWDGGVVEISTNDGATWVDLGDKMIVNPYNGTVGAGVGNNLANRAAFNGLVSTFINTTAQLKSFTGQTAKIRFRFGSDDNTAGIGSPTGWFVDDVKITDTASVFMRSSLFTAGNVKVNFADTIVQISVPAASAPAITAQPFSTNVCEGQNAVFTAAASGGTGNTFNWEVSTNGGINFTSLTPPVTVSTLNLIAVTAGMNLNQYRLVVTNSGGTATSNPAILTVTPAPQPLVNTPINYCQNATAAALTATGTNLMWYTTATGGTGTTTAPVVSTAVVGSTIYYVTQTTGTCESPRTPITVNVTATPAAPTVTTPVVYCQGATAGPLTATGANLKWYTTATSGTASTTAPTPSTTTVGTTTFYVSQQAGSCEGARAAIVVNVTAPSSAPIATTAVSYCQGVTATQLTATGTNLLWYTTATGGVGSATAPTPSTSTVGTTNYYVTQTGLCESARTNITVTVTSTPAAPVATTTYSYCQGSTAPMLTATGTNLQWYTVATAGTSSTTPPTPATTIVGTTTYYVAEKTGTCEGPRTAITVNITAAPIITTQPVDITSCATTATFTVVASGTMLTYQWFVSTDAGATYSPISGATNNSLVLTGLTALQANNKYRVVVSSGACTAATSNSVVARVGVSPVVVLTAAPVLNFNPYVNGGLYTTVSPPSNKYIYQWKRNGNIIANTDPSLTRANGLLEDFGSFVVTVTDTSTGCFGSSNAVSVSDVEGERNQLFVWPNPTNGVVKVSYYNAINSTQAKNVAVYNAKGARIISRTLNFSSGRYGTATVNLTNYTAGTYVFVLLDDNGNKLATERVIKY